MTTEATPLVAAPSYALGMVRAKLRLVRNPETDELFAFMGLFAPHQAFVVLGQGTAVHVKVIGYCIYVAVAATLLSCTVVLFPLDPERDLEAGTAGAWLVLTYGHVLFDMCLVALFGAFIHFIALLLLNPSALERHTWLRQLAAAEARLRANIVDAESNFEKQLASWSSAREDETARAVERIASLALSGVTPHVPKEMASEKKSMLSIRPVLEDAVFVEACSVVVKGWGRGTPLPSQIYGAVVAAAGAEPAYAVQPTACVAYDEAHSEVATARLKLDKAVAAAQLNGGSSHDDGAVVVSARRADLDAATSSEEAALTKCKGELLDYAFLTFQTSEQKSAVLLAARDGTLLNPGVPSDFTGDAPSPVTVHPAPNPRDVIWRSLEATDSERAYSHRIFMFSMITMGISFSAVMAMALTLGALLQCNSPFGGLADLLTEGDPQRFAYFMLMFVVVFSSVQLMIQPIFCVFADRGLFCNPKLRLMTCTYTALFAKGGSLWMWIEFLILSLVFIFHIFLTIRDQPGYTLALALTNITAMPDEEINFYFLYGSEVSGNLMLAALVEGFFCIWVLPTIGRWFVAPFQKTQDGVDRWCRMTDPAHLPFSTSDAMRVIAAGTLWSGLFPHLCPMLILYYTVATFVVRTNLLGRCEPGPPTKPLQYRFCFTFYLPLHLLLHIILCFGLYADIRVADPQNFGSGLFPGFQFHNFAGTPQKLLHSIFCLFAIAVVCVGLPYHLHTRCVREGVLTPSQLFQFFFCSDMADADFETSARASVGVHHLTTPSYFQPREASNSSGEAADDKTTITEAPAILNLPSTPADASLYRPICAIDLLATRPKLDKQRSLFQTLVSSGPSWLRP